jgi:hypothetical protein
MKHEDPSKSVECQHEGVTYHGTYYVEKSMVTVNSIYGSKSAALHSPADAGSGSEWASLGDAQAR